MRNLTVSKSINLNGCKEFNHLRIGNLENFFDDYQCNLDYYSPPFAILYELERRISFEDNPEEVILIGYKPGGDIIFRLSSIQEVGDLRVVTYTYDCSIS